MMRPLHRALFALLLLALPLVALPTSALAETVERFDVDGIPVRLVQNRDFDYVALTVVLRSGSILDPPGQEGLANLTAQMLRRGAGKMDQAGFEDALDFLGSRLTINVGQYSTSISGDSLGRNLERFLELVSTMLREPRFAEAQIAKQKRLIQAQIEALRENDARLGASFFQRLLFRKHPLGRPTTGTLDSLPKLSAAQIRGYYRRAFVKENLIVGFAGNIDRKRATKLVRTYFGHLPSGTRTRFPTPRAKAPTGRTILVVDKPKRTQTQVFIGHLGLQAASRHFFPLEVANTVFGGTFTARLIQEIREKRGWSYGAYSYNSVGPELGSYLFRFYPANKDCIPALKLGLQLFETLVEKGLDDKEIAFAKSYIRNSFAFRVETAQKRLAEALRVELLGLPDDFLGRYLERIQKTTRAGINHTLKTVLHPKDLVIVIVGTYATLEPQLSKLPGVSRILVNRYDRRWNPKDNAR